MIRFVALLLKIRIHLFAQVSSRAKCPACGIRAFHSVKWSAAHQQVIHACARCAAEWAEPPIVQAGTWAAPAIQQDAERVTTITHAQREPQIVKVK